jgi:hypothetical protein
MSDNLNILKRHFKALKNLRSDIHSMIPMETYRGQGDLLIRTYSSLHQAIAAILKDTAVDALTVSLPPDAKDREKVTHVTILVGQLVAHVEILLEEWKEREGEEPSDKPDDRIRRALGDE